MKDMNVYVVSKTEYLDQQVEDYGLGKTDVKYVFKDYYDAKHYINEQIKMSKALHIARGIDFCRTQEVTKSFDKDGTYLFTISAHDGCRECLVESWTINKCCVLGNL